MHSHCYCSKAEMLSLLIMDITLSEKLYEMRLLRVKKRLKELTNNLRPGEVADINQVAEIIRKAAFHEPPTVSFTSLINFYLDILGKRDGSSFKTLQSSKMMIRNQSCRMLKILDFRY